MARITVDDCLQHIDNRFDLVLLSSKRARQIAIGSKPMLQDDKDKPTVLALREIAEGVIDEQAINAIEHREQRKDGPIDAQEEAASVFPVPNNTGS